MRTPDLIFVYHLSDLYSPGLDAEFLGDLLLDHPDERFDALRRLRTMGFAVHWATSSRDDEFHELQVFLPRSGAAIYAMIDGPAHDRVNSIWDLDHLLIERSTKRSAAV